MPPEALQLRHTIHPAPPTTLSYQADICTQGCGPEGCGFPEHCGQLIRDRLVFWLADMRLSETIKLDKDLMLERVIEMVRQTEVKKQQS